MQEAERKNTGPLVLETILGNFLTRCHRIAGELIVSFECDRIMSAMPIVRMHSGCLFAHVASSTHCDCREQFAASQEVVMKHGRGYLLYSPFQEGKGHGLEVKTTEMALQREFKIDSVEAFKMLGLEPDIRKYDREIAVLRELGVPREIIHFSGNPRKRAALEKAGFDIVKEIEFTGPLGASAAAERAMKVAKMGYAYTPSSLEEE